MPEEPATPTPSRGSPQDQFQPMRRGTKGWNRTSVRLFAWGAGQGPAAVGHGKPREDMMRATNLAAIAAISLIASSTAAAAQSARPLSLANSPAARAGADVSGESSLDRRGAGVYIIGAVVLGLIIWGIIELTKDEDDRPTSP